MSGVALVNRNSAGGIILGGGNMTWTWNGKPFAVVGDQVAGHGKHGSPKMVSGSSWFTINGKGVCRSGDTASCGHAADGTESFNIA